MHDPLRPTFERHVTGVDPDSLLKRIVAALSAEGSGLPHRQAGHHLLIWLPKTEQHTWSPWLHLDVNPSDDDQQGATLFGRFTPAPSMWTALMFTYLVLAVLAIGGGIFGYSQWLLGDTPYALWLMPICLVLGLLIPLVSRAGQALAKDQMGLIAKVVEEALPR